MPTSLRAAAMSLAELLTHCDLYAVPEYQRVYGWGETEIVRLFSDLQRAMAADTPRIFLGTVYLGLPEGSRTAQIADGQQRLLTATIVYAAARDLADDPADAAKLHALICAPNAGGFRFLPRDRDAGFFRTWVQEAGATLRPFTADSEAGGMVADDPELLLSESQRNIIDNRDLIVETLRAMGSEARARLLAFHETAIDVVVISAPALDDARNAYASTQSRGLRQAETDKLKGELIGDCPAELRSRLAAQWEECEAILGKEDLGELLHHMILIKAERKPQLALEVDLFQAFALPRGVQAFIEDELVPSANAYRRLCAPTMRGSKQDKRINGHLITLLRTTHNAWKAVALLALRQLGNKPAALEAILRDLERLAAAMMIVGTDPNKMIERYVAVIRKMKTGQGVGAALAPTTGERTAARKLLTDTRFGMRERFRMPALLKLNDLLAGEVQAIDPKTVSCEHILPRNVPTVSAWREDFRASNRQRFDGRSYVHTLGNMALLAHAENRLADTRPYVEKRPILRRSAYALANDAGKSRVWTPEVVQARTQRLARLLIDYWRLDGDQD
jgi:hypothetical protein